MRMKKLLALATASILSVASLTALAACGDNGNNCEHVWGAEYTAGENGHYLTCTVCGEHNTTEAHKWGTFPTSVGASGHAVACIYCGAHNTTEAHNWNSIYVAGENGHYESCTDCGEHNTTLAHTWGTTNTSAGADGHYLSCTACNAHNTTVAHTWSTTYTADGRNGHYQACTADGCSAHNTTVAHEYDATTKICACGFKQPEAPTGSVIADINYKQTGAKDANWNRTDLHFRTKDEGTPLANYVTTSGSANPTAVAEDADGYKGVSGFSSRSSGSITITVNASAAGEVGLYIEMSVNSNAYALSRYWTLTVNGESVDVANAVAEKEGTNNAASNFYTFIGYVNLKAGENTIVLTRNNQNNNPLNLYGLRISAETATITGVAPTPTPSEN